MQVCREHRRKEDQGEKVHKVGENPERSGAEEAACPWGLGPEVCPPSQAVWLGAAPASPHDATRGTGHGNNAVPVCPDRVHRLLRVRTKVTSPAAVGLPTVPHLEAMIQRPAHAEHLKLCREIKKYQKNTDLQFQRAPFQRVVRELLRKVTTEEFRMTKDSLMALQEATEAYIVEMFAATNLAAIHAKRVTIQCASA